MKEFFSPFEDNLSINKDGHTIGFILTVDEAGLDSQRYLGHVNIYTKGRKYEDLWVSTTG